MIWILLVVFQFKHFIADYPLQGAYMLGKFKPGWDFVKPLAAHCAVHFALTFAIALCYSHKVTMALMVGLLDFMIHFIMDRVKASPKMLGRYKALSANEMMAILSNVPKMGETLVRATFYPTLRSNTLFWWSLGIDQMVHHLTDILVIYLLVTYA
jgi:hypothetical protein